MKETRLTLAATAPVNQEPPGEHRIFPLGRVEARFDDGRELSFEFDRAAAERVMEVYRRRGHDLTIDYNHQQYLGDGDDRVRRSAGSFELELRDDGLWMTNIRWTDDAAAYIRRREYRYISPAFLLDETRRVIEVLNVALVPNPATLGAMPLVASRQQSGTPPEARRTETRVDENQVRELIGLASGASSSEVRTRLLALTNFEAAVRQRLNDAPDRETAMGRLEALAASAAQSDQLRQQLGELQVSVEASERSQLISQALSARKLTPAQTAEGGWAQTVPLATLKAFLASAPTIVAGEIEQGADVPAEKTWDQLSGVERARLHETDRARYIELRKVALGY